MKEEVTVTDESQHIALLKQFQEDIKRCEKDPDWAEALKQIKENRKLARGKEQHVNMIHSTNQSMLPNTYAKNPDGSIIPSARAGKSGTSYMQARKFAESLEIVTNHSLREGKLKRRAKQMVRSAQTSRMGCVKIVMQRSFKEDPLIRSRIKDAQDNLALMESLARQIVDEEGDKEEIEARRDQLEQLITALEQKVEVVKAVGVVIDHIDILHLRVDPDIPSMMDYTDSPWIAHYVDYDAEYLRQKFGVDEKRLEGLTEFKHEEAKEEGTKLYRVWERWDEATNSVYTWLDGDKEWLKEPYVPQALGERWYPFFLFATHWMDGQKWPVSDVELLKNLQEEYNETRDSERKVRKNSKAYLVADGTRADPTDVMKIERVGDVDVIVMKLNGESISTQLQQGVQPPYNPALYDTSAIRSDMEYAVNVSDAARGAVEDTKTLGEAEIVQSHMASRSNERLDELESVLTEIYQYVAEMLVLELDQSMAAEIAGEGVFWPEIDKETLFKNVAVDIKGGSTTKPDRAREQKQWTELLPQIMELVNTIMQMRQGTVDPNTQQISPGVPDDQNPFVWLLEETLKRYDERISMDQILPGQQPQQNNVEQLPMQATA